LADCAPLVELALRARPPPEVAALVAADDPAVDRLGRPRPVVFAPDVDFASLLLACGTLHSLIEARAVSPRRGPAALRGRATGPLGDRERQAIGRPPGTIATACHPSVGLSTNVEYPPRRPIPERNRSGRTAEQDPQAREPRADERSRLSRARLVSIAPHGRSEPQAIAAVRPHRRPRRRPPPHSLRQAATFASRAERTQRGCERAHHHPRAVQPRRAVPPPREEDIIVAAADVAAQASFEYHSYFRTPATARTSVE
jgi:hypothetical protein